MNKNADTLELSDYLQAAQSRLPEALCLPFTTYSDSAIHNLEMEQIFEQKFVDDFFVEDQWICERVQQGMNSRRGAGGTLVLAVVNFHNYLASRIFGLAPTEIYEQPRKGDK